MRSTKSASAHRISVLVRVAPLRLLCSFLFGAHSLAAEEPSAKETIEFFGGRIYKHEKEGISILIGDGDYTDSNLVPKLAEAPSAFRISLDSCEFDPSDLSCLALHQATLRQLFLHRTPTDDAAMNHVGVLTDLELLQLAETKVTAAGMAKLVPLQKLTYLCFYNVDAGDECVPHLIQLKSLKTLEILGKHRITAEGKRQLRAALPGCDVAFGMVADELFDLKDEAVQAAARAVRKAGFVEWNRDGVYHIQIREQDLTADDLLAKFAEFPKLRVVTLPSCRFVPDDLRHLKPAQEHIRRLSLSGTPTDDAALKHIGALSKLEMLCLAGTQITSNGIADLIPLTELRYLTLGDTQVDDEAIEHLAKLKKLARIDIVGETQFTDAGRALLKRSLPNCTIEFREPER